MACPTRRGIPVRWAVAGLAAWLLSAGSVLGQTHPDIVVGTCFDLNNASSLGLGKSLRDAINEANAVTNDGATVTITFQATSDDPNDEDVFQPWSGAGWTHSASTRYYDRPLVDPGRIVVGDDQMASDYPANYAGQVSPGPVPSPLPTISRSNVRIDGDVNDDGIADVRIDLAEVLPTHIVGMSLWRAWGVRIARSAGVNNVVLEGLDIRFSMPNTTALTESVPAILIGGAATGNSVADDVATPNSGIQIRGCTIAGDAIGIETHGTTVGGVPDKISIGTGSAGANNTISGCSYAGIFIRAGTGQVTVHNNAISGNGSGTEPFSGGVVVYFTNLADNIIGGTVSGTANTISGNQTGVLIRGSGNNTIQQNTITSNTRNGVRIIGAGDNLIGGSVSTARNTISSNGSGGGNYNHAGIYIDPNGNGANTIQGNDITSNNGAGIFIEGDGANHIGGPASDARNQIGNNGAGGSGMESRAGIDIRGDGSNDGSNTIENNYIGMTTDGGSQPNGSHGINIAGNGNNTVGGTQTASRNFIGTNTLNGIRLAHSGTATIWGNYLGVNPAGTADLGNSVNGIEITDNAGGTNNIGGNSAAKRNVISGNNNNGIIINGGGTNNIYGNYLGLNAAGDAAIPNSINGITLTSQASGTNRIGSRQPGEGNVISGNFGVGISIQSTPAGGQNTVQGNYIGIRADATAALGNGTGGVVVDSAASAQIIGGSEQGDGNIIAGNGPGSASAHGIRLGGVGDNIIKGNLIGTIPATPALFPQDDPKQRLLVTTNLTTLRNGGVGILVAADATGDIEIGGTGKFEFNLVVNNGGSGIELTSSGSLTLVNNWVGAGYAGAGALTAIPNGTRVASSGILINGSGDNTLGGEPNAGTNTNYTNVIAGNTSHGINITGSGDNSIINNRIGTDADAAVAAANQGNGVQITGTGNNLLRNNRISGNTGVGVQLQAAGVSTLVGNTIGRAATADLAALANGSHGVYVPSGAAGRLVLGTLNTGEGNVLSGNTGDGVRLEGNVDNAVVNNLIGTDSAGTVAVGNGGVGIYHLGSSTSSTDVLANTVSGNGGDGVQLIYGYARLRRNRIGTDKNGVLGVGNTGNGILINDTKLASVRKGVVIGERSIANVDNGNVISANKGDGIRILQGGGQGATETDDILIRNNRIGLDVGGSNPLPNTLSALITDSGNGIYVAAAVEGKVQIGGLQDGEGNLISGNQEWGVRFEGTYSYSPGIDNAPLFYGNLIGTDVQGDQARANGRGGLNLKIPAGNLTNDPRRLTIGGSVNGKVYPFRYANLIAGNTGPGIQIDGISGQADAWVTLLGNVIGLDLFQQDVLPNLGSGVVVGSADYDGALFVGRANSGTVTAPAVTLAVDPDTRNVFSGNTGYGLSLAGSGQTFVVGNLLGGRDQDDGNPFATDFTTLTTGGGNQSGGVLLAGNNTTGSTIGLNSVFRSGAGGGLEVTGSGTFQVTQNTVKETAGPGIQLNGSGAYTLTNNTLTENSSHGVLVTNATNPVIGSSSVLAGTDNTGNTITFNSGDGVAVLNGTGIRVSDNLLQDNGVAKTTGVYNGSSLAIDRGNDGVTDAAGLKITSITSTAADGSGTWTIRGTIPGTSAAIELYQAKDPDTTAGVLRPEADSGSRLVHRGQVLKLLTRLTEANDLDTALSDFDAIGGEFVYTVPAGVVDLLPADATPFPLGTSGNIPESVLVTALVIDTQGNSTELARNTGKVSLTSSAVTLDKTTIKSNGSDTATARATIRDVVNTPLTGVTDVRLDVTDKTKLTFTQGSTTTDANGQVSATITATGKLDCGVVDTRNVVGYLDLNVNSTNDTGEQFDSDPLTIAVGDPSVTGSTIAGNPLTGLSADGVSSSTLTLTVVDANGCGVDAIAQNRLDVFEVVGGQPQAPRAGLTVTKQGTQTSAAGVLNVKVTSTVAGSFTFGYAIDVDSSGTFSTAERVNTAGTLKTVTLQFAAGGVDVNKSTIDAAPKIVQASSTGTTFTILTVTITDSQSNGITGLASQITISASPAATISSVSEVDAVNQPGVYTATAFTGTAGKVVFSAKVGDRALANTVEVEFTVGTPGGAGSKLEATPSAARPNGVDQIALKATVADESGNPVPNVTVDITAAPSNQVTITPASGTTNDSGVMTAVAKSTAVARVLFTATAQIGAQRITIGSVAVDFKNFNPDPAKSTLTVVTETPLFANGQRRATATLTLLDKDGVALPNIMPGEIVGTASLPGGATGVVVAGPTTATDAKGQTTFTVTSTTAGTVTIGATILVPVSAEAPTGLVTLNQTVTADFVPFLSQSYGPGLHFMGLSGQPQADDPRDVFSALVPNLKLARFDEGMQKMLVWDEFTPTALFRMTPGRGFWLQLTDTLNFTVVGQPTPLTTFAMALRRGWNQVANPYPQTWSFELKKIRVLKNGVLVNTLDQPAAQALVEPYGWRWDPVLQYLLLIDPSTTAVAGLRGDVAAGRGWWWLCRDDNVTVELPAPSGVAARALRAAPTPGQWLATLEASGEAGSAQVLLGASSRRLRAETPPPSPAGAELTMELVDAAGRAASDVREGPLNRAQSWDVEVTTRQAGPVQLSWSGLNRSLPAHHKLWLRDLATGKRLSMNSRAGYRYEAEAGKRLVRVELDPRGTRSLNIVSLSAQPGRGRGQAMPVLLTLSAPADITVTVRGAGGRLVRQWTEAGEEGQNSLAWDGRDADGRPLPSGLYQLEVTAQSDEGEVARAVRTVAIR